MNNEPNNQNSFDGQELRIRGDWEEVKGKLRQQYGDLTDDDLEYAEGKQEEWFGKLSQKVGHTVDDIKAWFKSL
ncbi:MAG: CsbD family protein [Bacteroidota bacterium]|nr:CsbD family protein [Bacteroidota bacterium]